MFVTLRKCSHCPAKLATSASAFGIVQHAPDLAFQHRRILKHDPWPATFSSSSSGMLLQRKNDSREASSKSLMLMDGGSPAGSRSTRKTNFGLARIRCSADSTPASKFPSRRLAFVEVHQTSQVFFGNRLAVSAAGKRPTDLLSRKRAQRLVFAGWQMKMRRLLGVSPGPVTSNGPVMANV